MNAPSDLSRTEQVGPTSVGQIRNGQTQMSQQRHSQRVIIIGGSIAGLLAANLFHRIGWGVQVFERGRVVTVRGRETGKPMVIGPDHCTAGSEHTELIGARFERPSEDAPLRRRSAARGGRAEKCNRGDTEVVGREPDLAVRHDTVQQRPCGIGPARLREGEREE